MHTFWKTNKQTNNNNNRKKNTKKKSKEQAQQRPSLHGRSDTPNSWKEKKKKNEPIVSLHEKSNSGKKAW